MKFSIYLAQSDTTAGLLSLDEAVLNIAKSRKFDKKILREISSFKNLKTRVPQAFRRMVKNSSGTTFVIKGKAFRKSSNNSHNLFLSNFKEGLFSTSANRHKRAFDLKEAVGLADVIILDHRGIFEAKSSRILAIKKKIFKIR